MDNDLKELAALALRNAFYNDFSALVDKYTEAAEGLDTDLYQAELMGEIASVHDRSRDAVADIDINIWTKNVDNRYARTTGHSTIVEALEHESAIEVHLQGRKVFERRDGKWYYVGNDTQPTPNGSAA